MLHLRTQRANLYISYKMTTNNAGWTRGWFYLHNDDQRLPAFTNRVLRERPPKWDWGVSPQAQQAKLEVLTDALVHLARKGLMAAAIIANFHRKRVIPLTERSLPIFGLTPRVPALGSRTSTMLLPRGITARRARNAVAEFPDGANDLWEIKMRPEPGFLSLVSLDFDPLLIHVIPFPSP